MLRCRFRAAAAFIFTVAVVLAATIPAVAQGVRSGSRKSNSDRSRTLPRPYYLELPPESLGPRSLGLLERDFMTMRATSPNPDAFANGRWNPRFQLRTPYPNYIPSYGGYGFGGYGGYGNGGYLYNRGGIYFNSPYGFGGYSQPYTSERVYIERQIIIIPQERANGYDNGNGGVRKRAPRNNGGGADQEFYLRRPRSRPTPKATEKSESLSDALAAVRQAWLNGDFDKLSKYLPAKGKVRLYLKGKFAYALEAAEFSSVTRDAMKRLDTLDFSLEKPTMLSASKAFVSGTHVVRAAKQPSASGAVSKPAQKTSVYISYLLEKQNGVWKITQAGSSTTPVKSHVD